MNLRTALVTGASSGIGRAVALALAPRVERLILAGRDRRRLEAVASLAGSCARVEAGDLTQAAELESLAAAVERETEALDVLVHAAGLFVGGMFADSDEEALDAMWRINVRAPHALTRRLLAPLVRARGHLVLVNSGVLSNLRAGVGAYAATKAALSAWTDCLRPELGPLGVRVLAIHPGRTATPMQEEVVRSLGGAYEPEALIQPEDVAAAILHALDAPGTAEVTSLHLRPPWPRQEQLEIASDPASQRPPRLKSEGRSAEG